MGRIMSHAEKKRQSARNYRAAKFFSLIISAAANFRLPLQQAVFGKRIRITIADNKMV